MVFVGFINLLVEQGLDLSVTPYYIIIKHYLLPLVVDSQVSLSQEAVLDVDSFSPPLKLCI